PDTRLPPSFPTRRSSDLVSVKSPTRFLVKTLGRRFPDIVKQSRPSQPNIVGICADIVYHFERMVKIILMRMAFDFLDLIERRELDRKSTRLNSSHVKISY